MPNAYMTKLIRSMRPDLSDGQHCHMLRLYDKKMEGEMTRLERMELDTLMPYQVERVESNKETCFNILATVAPDLVVCLSPTFRREMEAYRVAAWLCRLERSRGAKTMRDLVEAEEQKKLDSKCPATNADFECISPRGHEGVHQAKNEKNETVTWFD